MDLLTIELSIIRGSVRIAAGRVQPALQDTEAISSIMGKSIAAFFLKAGFQNDIYGCR